MKRHLFILFLCFIQQGSSQSNPHFISEEYVINVYDPIEQLVIKRRLYWSTTQLLVYLNEIKSSGMYVAKVFDDTKTYISTERLIIIK